MSYALNLGENNRILSATFEEYAAPGQPIVDELPEGNLNDYLYVNGAYLYDPLPMPTDGPIADGAIRAGEYFTSGEKLYIAKTKIPAGDPIKPGTNCTEVSLAAALNALNE